MSDSIVVGIVVGVIVVLIGLVLEYWTGWFSGRKPGTPSLPSLVGRQLARLKRSTAGTVRRIGEASADLIPLGALYLGMLFVAPEVRQNGTVSGLIAVGLMLLSALVYRLGKPPMSSVTAVLILLVVAAGRIFYTPLASQTTWPGIWNLRAPDMADPRTTGMAVCLFVCSSVWLAAQITSSHLERNRTTMESALALLAELPDVQRMRKKHDAALLSTMQAAWPAFRESLVADDSQAAKAFTGCVPVALEDGRILVVRCEGPLDADRINERRAVQGQFSRRPPFRESIERSLRVFFCRPWLELRVEAPTDRNSPRPSNSHILPPADKNR